MNPGASARRAHAFFLATPGGQRFCLFHAPQGPCRGAVLYVPPFGDEMNKARRMAALQARALAARGFGVLQLDLFGCGDSEGELDEASWDLWKADLGAASAWLDEALHAPLILWGLRLGALLALDYARAPAVPLARLLLWQPVQSGGAFLTQFLRLLSANEMLAEGSGDNKPRGAAALRASVLAGETLEVGGYALAPALAAGIDPLEMAALAPSCPVHWLEMVAAPERPLTPALERLARGWREQGVQLDLQRVVCVPFWSTQEITESDTLLAATCGVFETFQEGELDHAISRASA